MIVKMGAVEVLVDDSRPEPEGGLGSLGTERGNLPLESIEVRSSVAGLAVRTELAQGFHNPYDVPLEATYIFPLPDRAAVTALRMEAEDRVIEGVIKEREQARADYDRAVAEGRRASIAEEERPGVFTMRVGNIMPGERVVIRTTLTGRLPYEDGEATYRFPLVVAPRYIPGTPLPGAQVGTGTAADTDRVPDASRISPPTLLPGFPNPVRLSIEVAVDPAGLPLADIKSSLHGVTVSEHPERGLLVRLDPGDRADRDFILRLGFSSDAAATSLAVCRDEEGGTGTFLMTILPPEPAESVRPRDVVLVLDRSGSMDGWKMTAARRAAARIVDTLTSADRFAVLAFDDRIETPPNLPANTLVPATDRHRFRAVEHLATVDARGGTEMYQPLVEATRLLQGEDAARDRVLILVTDGQVGDEDYLLTTLAPDAARLRIHTVGIDMAVNAAFLRRLADLGGGHCELVESEDRLDDAMEHIHRRIGTTLVTGISLAANGLGLQQDSIAPSRIPDLFAGAPLVLSGRFDGDPTGAVTVTGTASDDTPWHRTIPAVEVADTGLARFWARGRIRDLEDRYASGRGDRTALEKAIVTTSVEFSVLSRFTAFVAVDSRVANTSGTLKQVTQPVDAPAGWDMLEATAGQPMPRRASRPMAVGAPAAAPAFELDASDEEAEGFRGAPRVVLSSRPAGPRGQGVGGGGPVSGSAPTGQPLPAYGASASVPAPKAAPGSGPADVAAAESVPAVPTSPVSGMPVQPAPMPPFGAPAPAPAPLTTQDLERIATAWLTRLRAAQDHAREPLLTELTDELATLLPRVTGDIRHGMATVLSTLTSQDQDLETRWQAAIAFLESLTTPRRRFWKR